MSCSYMTSALIAGTERMNIIRRVLVVITTIALVCDLKQHSCNMARAYKVKTRRLSIRHQLDRTAKSKFFIMFLHISFRTCIAKLDVTIYSQNRWLSSSFILFVVHNKCKTLIRIYPSVGSLRFNFD